MTTIRDISRALTSVPLGATFEGEDDIGSFKASLDALLKSSFGGCMATLTADQTGKNFVSSATPINWDSEEFDVGGWHSTTSNNNQLVVPADFNGRYAQFGCNVRIANSSSGNGLAIILRKNGSLDFKGNCGNTADTSFPNATVSFTSGPILLATGDTFDAVLISETDTSIDIIAARSNFWVRVC